MNLKVNIKDLRDAILQASHTLDTKKASIGSWLYLFTRTNTSGEQNLYVYSTNLGLSRTLLKLSAVVTKEGEACIPPKLLQSAILGLPDDEDVELGLSASGAKLQVKYGSLKSEIATNADGQKAAEILKTFPFNAKPNTSISASTLVTIINRVLFCTATSAEAVSEGPWLSSIYMETGDSTVMGIATNKILAGRAEVSDGLVTSNYSISLHRDALVALKTLLSKRENEEVTITNASTSEAVGTSPNEVLFRFSDVILGIRQLSSTYPKAVGKIFTTPSDYSRASVNRQVLLNSLSRLSAFAEKNSLSISLCGGLITLYTKGFSSIFQEQIAKTEITEGNVTIGLSIADVSNAVSVMQSEELVIWYKSDDKHVYFQEGESNFIYVLSPVVVAWAIKAKAA